MSSQTELDASQEEKNRSNKPNDEIGKTISKRDIRLKLARDLWEQYQKPELTMSEKIKIATILAKITERGKTGPNKPLFQ